MKWFCFVLACLLTVESPAQSIGFSSTRNTVILSRSSASRSEAPPEDRAATPDPPVFVEVEDAPVTRKDLDTLRAELKQMIRELKTPEPKPAEKMLRYPDEKVVAGADKPIVEIYLSTGHCPPCERLKAAIANGGLYGVGVRRFYGGASSYPTIKAGGRTWTGFGDNTLREVLDHLRVGQSVSRSVSQPQVIIPQSQIIRDEWGEYDPATYVGCGSSRCNMCVTRAARRANLLRQYRPTSYSPTPQEQLSPEQQPTPMDVVKEIVAQCDLTPADIIGDLGCGDGRILIEAVRSSGCRGVGVEIDPDRAAEARQAVAAAGLSDKIEIITGDMFDFRPADHGVTALVAYQYPEMLIRLRDHFREVPVGVSPFHEVPGLNMKLSGNVWVYRRPL